MDSTIDLVLTIAAPPAHVFDWIEDPEKQRRWMKDVVSNEAVAGPDGVVPPTGVGTRSIMKIKEGRRISEYQIEVTEIDRPRRLAVVMTGGCFPAGASMRPTYELESRDGGAATQLTYRCACHFPAPGFFLRLFMPLFSLFGKRMLRGMMRSLKEQAEASAPSATTA